MYFCSVQDIFQLINGFTQRFGWASDLLRIKVWDEYLCWYLQRVWSINDVTFSFMLFFHQPLCSVRRKFYSNVIFGNVLECKWLVCPVFHHTFTTQTDSYPISIYLKIEKLASIVIFFFVAHSCSVVNKGNFQTMESWDYFAHTVNQVKASYSHLLGG